ncbi:MAG TPA: hypothetical protein V6D25_25875 [Leptolyngbyaceae cyanobacterium]
MTNHHKISLLELIGILTEYRNNFIINIKHLRDNYQRTSIKRIPGVRDINGEISQPWLRTEYLDNVEYVRVSKFDLNRNTATLNMLVQRQVKLVKAEDKTPVLEVAGLLVNELNSFNNYTIVCDGRLNIKSLQVKISSKKLFEILKQKNVVDADDFDFRQEYTIHLDTLPLISNDVKYTNLDGLFDELAEIKVLSSIIAAHLKGESDVFVPPQLDDFKSHYLSSNVYINFPTTKEYENRQQAIDSGQLESRISYKIDIGSKEILNLNKFYSANKFLDRMYRVYDKETGEIFTKPNFVMAFNENLAFRHKLLSSRMKITKADELMQTISDDFLGLDSNGKVKDILVKVGADSLGKILQSKNAGESVSKGEMVAALTEAKTRLDEYTEQIYQEKISPLVFYIGVTGKLPDAMVTPAMTAEELATQYPDLEFSKYEQAGTFFVVGDSIISVYPQLEYYSQQTAVTVQ